MLESITKELPTGWKVMRFTVDAAITRADELANLLTNNIPDCQFAIGILNRDWSEPPSVNNTCTDFFWNTASSDAKRWVRYRNGVYAYMLGAQMASTYDCQIAEGAEFVVLYLE